MTHKQYLRSIFIFVSLSLLTVGTISYKVDPARIYHVVTDADNSASAYADRLLRSKSGLLWPNGSWNERDIKISLAKNNNVNADCAIIGSSHVMPISSFRENKSLNKICPSLINLGVAGGSLEDYLAMSYELIQKERKPKTIVFGVDPWALDFLRDVRWRKYRVSYDSMKKQLNSKDILKESNRGSKWKHLINLINPSYFFRSVQQMGQESYEIQTSPIFDYSKGIKQPVILPDGSLIYSKIYMEKSDASRTPIGGTNYGLKKYGSQFSELAIKLFTKLILYLNKRGVDTVIVMTPYHHNVWLGKESITTRSLIQVERRIRVLGKELGIKVLGSYNPDTIGCIPDEFFDHMHAKPSCLSKIEN